MTTEEKNARNTAAELLAEKETKNLAGPVAKDVTASMIKRYFNKGWDARDKEVSDLVEALREVRKEHIHHRTMSESVSLDSSYAQGVIAHNEFVDDLDELLSKYPVNTLPNG